MTADAPNAAREAQLREALQRGETWTAAPAFHASDMAFVLLLLNLERAKRDVDTGRVLDAAFAANARYQRAKAVINAVRPLAEVLSKTHPVRLAVQAYDDEVNAG